MWKSDDGKYWERKAVCLDCGAQNYDVSYVNADDADAIAQGATQNRLNCPRCGRHTIHETRIVQVPAPPSSKSGTCLVLVLAGLTGISTFAGASLILIR